LGLQVGEIAEGDFSDTVPLDAVLRAQPQAGATVVRVGDTVDLITSKGVEMIPVPDVVGETWTEAKQKLIDAGFSLDYNLFADAAPSLFTVTKLTPAGGTSAPKGSTVKVNFSS
jgi:serine/threonine-protein kinase